MNAAADARKGGGGRGLSFSGGESLAWLSCMRKHRRALHYDIIAQVVRLPANYNSSVRLLKRLLRTIVDAGINWHGSNQCVICLVDYEMLLKTGLCFKPLS